MCDCRCSTSRPETSPTAADSRPPSRSSPATSASAVVVGVLPVDARERVPVGAVGREIVHGRNISQAATMEAMRYVVLALAALLVVVAVAVRAGAGAATGATAADPHRTPEPIDARRDADDHGRARRPARLRRDHAGTTRRRSAARRATDGCKDGVQLPELGEDFFTWDPVHNEIPNREWRRWGTDRLIRTVLTVLHEYRTERDSAQRVGIMDLSRPHGGRFGAQLRRPRARLAPERPRRRHPLSAQGRHRDARDEARRRSIASSRRTSSTASSPPARSRSSSART